jgi:cyclic beta-1,2-glucan synthetase
VQLSHLGIDADQAALFQRLAGHVLYADPSLRPSVDAIRRGGGIPAVLWAHGISGDLPIVLVRIDNTEDIAIVRQLLRAHEYWRTKQLAVDLVILNERPPPTSRTFTTPSRRWCGRANRGRRSDRMRRAARCSCCART